MKNEVDPEYFPKPGEGPEPQPSLGELFAGVRPHEARSEAERFFAKAASSDLIRDFIATLTDETIEALRHDWSFWGRDEQQWPEGSWSYWLILAGRGFGKTRTGAECMLSQIRTGNVQRVALVGKTPADVRKVMILGKSGLMSIGQECDRPIYEPSKLSLSWPQYGCVADIYSGANIDAMRGPEYQLVWVDELAAFAYPTEVFDQMAMTMRQPWRNGTNPRAIITTTPKPIEIIRRLTKNTATKITRGSTYANRENLDRAYFDQVLKQYEGTRLGRQELLAEVLDDVQGALWSSSLIERTRTAKPPQMRRVVVAVDPAATSRAESDETGIVAAGIGVDGLYYVLDDRSMKGTPTQWANAALALASELGATQVVAEKNNGGEMVETVIRAAAGSRRTPPIKLVHASKGKITRAEPISALYEQSKVCHVGFFPRLEEQMTSYTGANSDSSPDRMDALVWALTELSGPQRPAFAFG